jgi:hypothetical protein
VKLFRLNPKLRGIATGLAFVLIVIQFVRPQRNLGVAEGPGSLVELHHAPPAIRQMLDASCNDCHSNRTHYPWYAEIQPVGWLVAHHVRDGKRAINFSEFAQLGAGTQAKRLQYAVESMQERMMPPGYYRRMHREAGLSAEQIAVFATWAESVRARLRD